MKNKTTISILIIVITIVGFCYLLNKKIEISNVEEPFHKLLNKDCDWIRREFPKSGISFYEEQCPNAPAQYAKLPTYFESEDGKIMSTNPSVIGGKSYLVIEILNKDPNQTPLQIMEQQWYSKLNSKQKNDCSIQDSNMPLEGFEGTEAPHKVDHKTRYDIALKPEVAKSIADNNDMDALSNPKFSYLCGDEVGSLFDATNPYFEFDDRSPSKYLFIHLSWNDQGPNIDLNTIRF